MSECIDSLRCAVLGWAVPDFVKYSLPDGLYCAAYILLIDAIWGRQNGIAKYVFISIIPFATIICEILQYLGIVNGTFDVCDLICYAIPILIYGLIEFKKKVFTNYRIEFMKKYFCSMFVLAFFAIGFTASDETETTKDSVQEKEEVTEKETKEESQPKEDPDVQHFVGDYIYSYYIGNTNAKLYFKISLKSDGTFIWEPNNEVTKNQIDIEKVMDGNDFPEGGEWEVKDTSVGKGAFLDFDCSWGEGSITYDRKVLEIQNMNGYRLKAELSYQAPKVLPKVPDSPEAMIKEFYQTYILGDNFPTNDIIDAYLSSDVKNSIIMEEDGVVGYEFWRFRTIAQDYSEETGNINKVKDVKSDGDGWYTVTYLDMGHEGETRVKVVNSKIVELKPDKSWDSWDE